MRRISIASILIINLGLLSAALIGQVAGWSYTTTSVNATTGLPTQHPFIWEDGHFRDLGTLGGTYAVAGAFGGGDPPGGGAINNRGQVAGTSNLSGDANWHPYIWFDGTMTDLGTLGGANGEAYWINDNRDVVGQADIAGSRDHHAFLWRRGKMIDLGAAPGWPCSTALAVNIRGEVIINTGNCNQGDHHPSWSPQGDAIVFQRVAPDFSSSAIYIMKHDGTGCRKLLSLPNSSRSKYPRANQVQSRLRSAVTRSNPTQIETGGARPQWGVAPN